MIPLADNDMQVTLSAGLSISDPRLEDVLGLLDELPVQVDRVGWHAVWVVILAEDEFRGLLVVGVLLPLVFLAFFREGFGCGAVARGIRFMGLLFHATSS